MIIFFCFSTKNLSLARLVQISLWLNDGLTTPYF